MGMDAKGSGPARVEQARGAGEVTQLTPVGAPVVR